MKINVLIRTASIVVYAAMALADDDVAAVVLGQEVLRADLVAATELLQNEPPPMWSNMLVTVDRDAWLVCTAALPLVPMVNELLMSHFIAENPIEITPTDIEQYVHYTQVALMEWYFEKPVAEFDFDVEAMNADYREEFDSVAELTLMTWIIQNKLYDRFGGRIAEEPYLGAYAVDAFERYLREAEEQALFRILDEELRRAFWVCHGIRNQIGTYLPDEIGEDRLREYPGKNSLRAMSEHVTRLFDIDIEVALREMPAPPDWPESRWAGGASAPADDAEAQPE